MVSFVVVVVQLLSCVPLFCDPIDCSHQVPLSMAFSRQEYWSELPFPSPGDFPNPGIEPMSFASLALAGGFFTTAPKSKQEMVIVVMSIFEICFESCYSVPYNVCHQYAMSFQVCGQYMSSFPNPQSNPCSHLPVVLAYPLEYN